MLHLIQFRQHLQPKANIQIVDFDGPLDLPEKVKICSSFGGLSRPLFLVGAWQGNKRFSSHDFQPPRSGCGGPRAHDGPHAVWDEEEEKIGRPD